MSIKKYAKALNGEGILLGEMLDSTKIEVLKTTYSLLILHLSNNVLKQVDDVNTTTKLWLKLESLYMTKSLTNKIY